MRHDTTAVKVAMSWYGTTDKKSGKGRLYISISQNPPQAEPLPRRLIDLIYTRIQKVMPEDMMLAGISDENGQDLLAPEAKN